MSMLHRLGAAASLTLGNKKAVDIIVARDVGRAYTIDVKGLAGGTCWPVGNAKVGSGHFVVLVCFKHKIGDPHVSPEVYVVPSRELRMLATRGSGAWAKVRIVKVSDARKKGAAYRDAWWRIVKPLARGSQ